MILNHMVEDQETQLDLIFAALSDRTRRMILLMLLEEDQTISTIAAPFDTSLASISKHVQILATAGLITQHKSGREKWCRLNTTALQPAAFWIESYGSFVDDGFEMLEKLLISQELEAPDPD